jgi:hypothetical protein
MFAQLADKEKLDDTIKDELHPKEGVQVRIALIGVGAVAAFHHIPGIRIDPRAALTAICDQDTGLLEKRKEVESSHVHSSFVRNGVQSLPQLPTKNSLLGRT